MSITRLKIVTVEELVRIRSGWKSKCERVVFTNGCFDLLHLGHLDYLEQAKALGDRLIVAVNSDASVERLKGPHRPVHSIEARLRALAALDFVDVVSSFADDTPEALIANLLPDVLVKGGDYEKRNIAGADIVMENGGKVLTIPILEGYSTTELIQRIKSL